MPAPGAGGKLRSHLFRPLGHFWWALGQLYYELISMTLKINVLWTLTVLPLMLPASLVAVVMANPEARDSIAERIIPVEILLITPLVTAFVLLISGPGTAAMYFSAYRFIDFEPVTYALFWQGFKRYFVRGWLLAVTDMAGLYILLIGFMFYWFSGEILQQIIAVVFVYLLLFWMLMQPYLFVLIVRLDLSVFHTLRNAAVLVIGNPGVTLGLGLISLLSAVFLPIFNILALIIGPCVVALTGHRVTADLLEDLGITTDEAGDVSAKI